MFNVNAGLCLDCAPWEAEFPAFCHQCGVRLQGAAPRCCPICGARLLVGGTAGGKGAVE